MHNPENSDFKLKTQSKKPLIDEYGNLHYLADELARGGQGIVFRTTDADLAIKKPLYAFNNPDENIILRNRFQNVRLLPLPQSIPISLPLSILRDESGYVMRLLNGMKPFSVFDLNGKKMEELRVEVESKKQVLPRWLASVPDEDWRLRFFHYTNTGSTRRRLLALSKCASILARLHSEGMVYCDISQNNAFIGDGESHEVWLIDADNLRFERIEGGNAVYTPHYGAPEVVQGLDPSRPRSDCWAFAVMSFRMLTLCHPFIGKKVLEADNVEDEWDVGPTTDSIPTDLYEQAYAGFLTFIDDKEDDTNADVASIPRDLVTTESIRKLFQETFGPGRTQPHRRPAMAFWAIELTRAFDQSLTCPECSMSYFFNDHRVCPYCEAPRPAFVRAWTRRWEMLISAEKAEFSLPHRLFNPFSFQHNDATEYEAEVSYKKRTIQPLRGTAAFPLELKFEFVEAEK